MGGGGGGLGTAANIIQGPVGYAQEGIKAIAPGTDASKYLNRFSPANLFGLGGQSGGNNYSPIDPGVRPDVPKFINATPLSSDLQVNPGANVGVDTTALNELQNRALSTGPSAWAQQASQQAKELTGQQLNNAQQQGASTLAAAQSQLASKYGLSPAAQERLQTMNSRDQMNKLQNVGFQGNQALENVNLQDQQMKNQYLSQVPGFQQGVANIGLQNRAQDIGAQGTNLQAALQQNAQQNAANQYGYGQQMQGYAAAQNANAIGQSGGGGKK